MIDFTIHHKKEPLNKVVAVELPMNANNLSDLLQELEYEPPEKLKVNSKGKLYVVELNTGTNMGIIQDKLDRDYKEQQAMAEKQEQSDDEPDEDEDEESEDEDEDLDESEDPEESENEGMSMDM